MGCVLVPSSFDRIAVLQVEFGKEFAGIGRLRERNGTQLVFLVERIGGRENLRQHGAPFTDCKRGSVTAKMMAQIGTM